MLDASQIIREDRLTADDIGEVVDRYRRVLEQLDAPFPKPFILQDMLRDVTADVPAQPPAEPAAATPQE